MPSIALNCLVLKSILKSIDLNLFLDIIAIMKKLLIFPLLFIFCSDAPKINFPEPTSRIVLAEMFTEDG